MDTADRLADYVRDGVPSEFKELCRDAEREVRELRSVLWSFVRHHRERGTEGDMKHLCDLADRILAGTFRDDLAFQLRVMNQWHDDLARENAKLRTEVRRFGRGVPWWKRFVIQWKRGA